MRRVRRRSFSELPDLRLVVDLWSVKSKAPCLVDAKWHSKESQK
jgi:hypothetical protein